MAQHDYNIANQSGADFRADLNNALLAIATVNSGATEPSTTFAHQLWVDTSSSVLKIRNSADNAWITTGVSITASNTFTGNLTGNVTGNLTGNVTGNVIGDLTGNADTATILATARTISLSGDVAGSASFDGSGDITISTTAQIDSIALGTDTTGDYVQSISGGTGVTITGGTGEGSTPSVAIGQSVATTDDVTFNIITATNEFIGDLEGGIRFNAKADGALSKGDVVYISGVSGDVPTVAQAKADDASKMPAFGLALSDANDNAALQVVTFGTIEELDTSGVSEGQILYVSTTAGAYTTTAPTGESSQIQNIGKVIRSHAAAGSIKVGGAGRSNATPNLNNGKIFIGNGSNQSSTATLDTSIVVENTNLYYTTTRANTDFDTRLATKDTGDLTEGSNLYYTTARVNSDFDTRLATKDTGDLAEGSNLYYTDARVNSAFDTRLATKDTDDLTEGTTNLYYTSGRANTDFDTRLATKSTTNLAEGTNLYYTTARFDSAFTSKDTDDLSEGTTNLYYTTARFDSAFGNKTTADLTENTNLYYTDTRANSAIDTRVTKAFVDALGIQASSVAANSVTLGTDTVGNYVATVTGTANKITVSGSGSESAAITLSLPDDVQIADSLTVAGNLTVNGTLTSLDTTNLDIEDNLFQLNAGLTGSPVNDSGMLINRGTADNSIFMWDESVDKFTLGLTTADGSATGNITLNSLGTLVANLEGNVTGNVTGTVSSLSNHDTDDLAEGTNLYYTQARFDSALAAKSTSDLSEGSNLYYTDARFDTRLATKDTDDVSEGTTNLYYTTARFDSAFGGKSTTDLSEGTNLYYTSARANSDFDTRLATKSTSDLSEGSNLYYTDARAQAVSINNVVEDTTPQLGGNLDLNSSDITGTGDINITGTIQSSGNITGTLATAAQPNITSLGTLTALTGGTGDLNWDSGTLFVDSSANAVGIGTTSPSRKLHVVESANNDVATFINNDATNGYGLNINAGGTASGRYSLRVANQANSVVLQANADGNVGIGTSSPQLPLHVKGDFPTSVIERNAGTGGAGALVFTNSTTNGIYISGSDTTYTVGHVTDYEGSPSYSEKMRIDSSGNVGIGTSSPSYPLTIGTAGTTADTTMLIASSTTTAGNLFFGDATTGVGSYRGFVQYDHNTDSMRLGTTSAERMRIDSSGNTTFKTSAGHLSVEALGGGSVKLNSNGSLGMNVAAGYSYEIDVGGSEVFRINSSGNVGIGETNPDASLHITSNTPIISFDESDAGQEYRIGSFGGSFALYDSTDSAYRLIVDGSGKAIFKGVIENELYSTFLSAGASSTVSGYVGRASSVVSGGTATDLGVGGGAGNLVFAAGGATERMRIKSDGQITTQGDILPGADVIMANGRGISFAASSNAGGMTSELLDDYEEGTWTPTFVNLGTGSYNVRIGVYTKIGNLVTVQCHLDVADPGNSSGVIRVSGFPFAAHNTTYLYGVSSSIHGTGWTTQRGSLNFLLPRNATETNDLYYNMANTSATTASHADIGSGNLLFSMTYRTT